MAQQTPVDWLVEKLNQIEPFYSGIGVNHHHINKMIAEAKRMQQEMVEKAWEQRASIVKPDMRLRMDPRTGSEYYYDTYGEA